MRNFINYLTYVPKHFAYAASALLLVATAVATPLTATKAFAQDAIVEIESNIGVANVTAGDTQYKDVVDAKVDDVVKVQVWYHNREEDNSGKIAEDLRMKIGIPSAKGKNQTITSTVSATNSNTVNDSAKVNLSLDNAYLEYVPGSAKWRHNAGTNSNVNYQTETISDDVVKSGTGVVLEDAKPCFNFEATVTVLARVKADAVSITKKVRTLGEDQWQVKNTAKPGETLEYLITFKNEGNTRLTDVAVGDNLPGYMQYVPGTARLRNGAHPNGIKVSDNITTGGINVGHYDPGAVGYVWFQVKLDDKSRFEKCGEHILKNVGVVRPKGMNEFYNTAHTTVNVVCAAQPTPGQPEALPNTGVGSALAGLGGSGFLGAAVRTYLRSRRQLADALLEA